MNYSAIYTSLIEHARTFPPTGYVESHHIVPRCMGGDNSPANLVNLTGRQHRIAHILLAKAHPKNRKLQHAAAMMFVSSPSHAGRAGKHVPDYLRKNIADALRHRWVNSGARAKMLSGIRQSWDADRRVARSEDRRVFWSDQSNRDVNREKLKDYWATGGHTFDRGGLTDEQQQEVCRRHIDGETIPQLAKVFSSSNRSIVDAIQKFHPTKKYKSATFSDADVAELCRLREVERKSWRELATLVGKSASTVRRAVLFHVTT